MKRRSLKWVVPILVLMCVAMSVHETQAEERAFVFVTGNRLVDWMRGYDNTAWKSCSSDDLKCIEDIKNGCFFLGYVVGVHDVTWRAYSIAKDGDVTDGQLAAVVSKYLKEHPERWSFVAFSLVEEALIEAFPLDSGFTPLPIRSDRKSKVK